MRAELACSASVRMVALGGRAGGDALIGEARGVRLGGLRTEDRFVLPAWTGLNEDRQDARST
jgi:hypothetical protein